MCYRCSGTGRTCWKKVRTLALSYVDCASCFDSMDASYLFLLLACSPFGEVHWDNSEAVKTPLDSEGHRSFVAVVMVHAEVFCIIGSALSLTAPPSSCSMSDTWFRESLKAGATLVRSVYVPCNFLFRRFLSCKEKGHGIACGRITIGIRLTSSL